MKGNLVVSESGIVNEMKATEFDRVVDHVHHVQAASLLLKLKESHDTVCRVTSISSSLSIVEHLRDLSIEFLWCHLWEAKLCHTNFLHPMDASKLICILTKAKHRSARVY